MDIMAIIVSWFLYITQLDPVILFHVDIHHMETIEILEVGKLVLDIFIITFEQLMYQSFILRPWD